MPETMPEPPAHGARVELRTLSIRDFRNLARVELAPPAAGLAIVGENGHGKTNLLEAVYYLQLFRSARGARDQELVRFGERGFHVAAAAAVGGVRRTIGAGFDRSGRRKKVVVDGAEVARLSSAFGALPSVMVSPRDVSLVTGAPAERRRFLDVVLALTSHRYLAALQRYRASLVHRNAALRQAVRGRQDEAAVAVWEPALAEHGAVLWRERLAWVERWAPEYAQLCEAIGERSGVELRYSSRLPAEGDLAETLRAALEAKRALDIKRGLTHAGPHRDDVALQLGGRELRLYGSAGQQRTAALALRILESRTLRAEVGAAPILLLDDPFAELDARRSRRILALLSAGGLGQTLLAVPREADIPPELTSLERCWVADGALHGTPPASADADEARAG